MNQNTITQNDVNHLMWCKDRFKRVYGESLNTDYMILFQSIIQKLQANLDAEKELNKKPQLTRIEETVNYIKEALQPMESDIEFNPVHEKGQELLQELVEKWKAKESKPTLTDVFIQMLKDREKELLEKYFDPLLLVVDEHNELLKIQQIIKNL